MLARWRRLPCDVPYHVAKADFGEKQEWQSTDLRNKRVPAHVGRSSWASWCTNVPAAPDVATTIKRRNPPTAVVAIDRPRARSRGPEIRSLYRS